MRVPRAVPTPGKAGILLAGLFLVAGCSHRDGPEARSDGGASWPETRAESTEYRATSTSADVLAFLRAVARDGSCIALDSMGSSGSGADLPVALAACPPVATIRDAAADPRSKVVIVANIHAGEVEAKEAVQVILREIAQGRHREALERRILVFVPNYNPDGNDAISTRSRPDQAGPPEGVGRRTTAAGLDLNRDFTKAQAAETRALVALVRGLDPILLVDGHTTDGSYHGFDLTYAGPLSPATDPDLLDYSRGVFLPALRSGMRAAGFETYDYGNWEGEWRPPVSRGRWETYDHLPRYGTNYVGLRNRMSLLSEAYVYAPFARRIAATRELILTALMILGRDQERLVALERAADARACALEGSPLPTGGRLAFTEETVIPASSVRRHRDAATGTSFPVATGVNTWLNVRSYVHFEGLDPVLVPRQWAIRGPSERIRDLLDLHGIRWSRLTGDRVFQVESFVIDSLRPEGEFQGHHRRALVGHFESRPEILAEGTLVVDAAQPLARLAFGMLEALAPDGVAAWDILPPEVLPGGGLRHAVLRLLAPPAAGPS